ncbi:MAG: hypothetical protein HY719_01200 [Planctomycetes bacterium]|nr:hypothetical protein [Planctomycetota bacterium]
MALGTHLLGIDGGATKTTALLADLSGRVAARADGPGSNFQACGLARAERVLASLTSDLLARAGVGRDRVAAAAYGLAGADREKDFATLRPALDRVAPCPPPARRLVNDTLLALRAATVDGVGVALIAGTGTNAIGVGRDGRVEKVGGLGRLGGDWGCGADLGEAACVAAARSLDGRGPPTMLAEMIRARLGLTDYFDIVELTFHDSSGRLDLDALAPLVFEAARAGDGPAREILARAGEEQARAGVAVATRLFSRDDEFVLALGGSIFQKGGDPTLVETVSGRVREAFARARVALLSAPPALGALYYARDLCPQAAPHHAFALAAAATLPAPE